MNPTTTLPANPWTQLQTELRDLAFLLDRRGNPAAADVATTIAARIDELLTPETRGDTGAGSQPPHPLHP